MYERAVNRGEVAMDLRLLPMRKKNILCFAHQKYWLLAR